MTTKRHFTEADLLETYYTQPGESMPVMMHLARCSDCAARYERLERKLREAASCDLQRPETFWARQRMTIMRRIEQNGASSFSLGRSLRVAAAAIVAFALGGAVVYETVHQPVPQTSVAQRAVQPAPVERIESQATSHDAWQSDELKDFHNMVEWEAWVDPQNGGQL